MLVHNHIISFDCMRTPAIIVLTCHLLEISVPEDFWRSQNTPDSFQDDHATPAEGRAVLAQLLMNLADLASFLVLEVLRPEYTLPVKHAVTYEPSDWMSNSLLPGIEADLGVPSEMRFLLTHYATHVAHLLAPTHLEDSIWKTSFLDLALNCYAKLSVFGEAESPAMALLYGMLAISAYHMDVVYKGQEQYGSRHDDSVSRNPSKWNVFGRRYEAFSQREMVGIIEKRATNIEKQHNRECLILSLMSAVIISVSGRRSYPVKQA